jgi:mannose/fructose/N-acetylgalactosamine-specific phosphotransferase system component IID
MLSLHFRHVATGVTVDLKEVAKKNGNSLTVDLRDATMTLIDKVAVEKGMSVVDAMQNSQVEIIAKWEIQGD